jgi:hypothetical protein
VSGRGRDAAQDIARLACHNDHAFVYVLCLLRALQREAEGAGADALRRLEQEIEAEAAAKGRARQAEAFHQGMDDVGGSPEASRAIASMVLAPRRTSPPPRARAPLCAVPWG